MEQLNEKQLWFQAKKGCKDSMRAIYIEHKDHLLTLAQAMVNDRSLAEDLVQDVFVAFAQALPGLILRKSIRAYLITSICNRVRDRYRRQGVRTRLKQQPNQKEALSPEEVVSLQEQKLRLYAALQILPWDQREVVLLRAKAGLTFAAIAEHQGVGINTAQGRYRYGIEKLRSLLQNAESEGKA